MDYFVRSCSKYAMKDYDNNQIGAFFDEAASNEAHREYLLKHYACGKSMKALMCCNLLITIVHHRLDCGFNL